MKEALKGLARRFFSFKGDDKRQIILKIAFLVSFVAFLASGTALISYRADSRKAKKETDEAREIWHSASYTERYDALKKENHDFRAWLSISEIGIDHPVYQADDDAYYLKHGRSREPSRHGALFFSCEDTVDNSQTDKNLIIFGHNMKDGSMFAPLTGYRNQEFFEQNREITLSVGTGDYTYEIFAVCIIDVTENSGEQVDITRDSFETSEQLSKWAAEVKAASVITSDITPEFGNQMLTLITCGDDYAKTRIAVSAVLKNRERK